jgi:hypothetical protein
MALKPLPPKSPEKLPLLEHNNVSIETIQHHGFSTPLKGSAPKARTIYGARNPANNERHWRSTYEEIVGLIDRGFSNGEES